MQAIRHPAEGDDVTDADLKAIQARADAATPGPWCYIHDDDAMCMNCYAVATDADADPSDPGHAARFVAGCLVQSAVRIAPPDLWHENTTFIAHARADVPALLAEVRLLRGIIADQQKESGLFDAGFKTGWRSAMETAERVVVHYGEADASGPSPGGAMTAREFVDTYQTDQLTVAIRRMANDGDLRQHASTE